MIGERLREVRIANHCTQKEIAAHLHITRTAYSYYESGFRKPTLETLQKVADYFQVSLDYLYGRTNEADFISIDTEPEVLLLDRFRSADERGKDTILNTAYYEYVRKKHLETVEKTPKTAKETKKKQQRKSAEDNESHSGGSL